MKKRLKIIWYTLLILLRNYNLKGLINQNQSIIQFTKTVNAKKMNGVGKVYIIEKKEFIENKIQIYSEQNLIVNAKFEILLDFFIKEFSGSKGSYYIFEETLR